VGAGLARERPVQPAGRIPETFLTTAQIASLGSCRVAESHPFAGRARSHKVGLVFGPVEQPAENQRQAEADHRQRQVVVGEGGPGGVPLAQGAQQ
jgi:hypothetical protein